MGQISSLSEYYTILQRKSLGMAPHMDYLRSLAVQCDVAVEFGTRHGCSTTALLYANELWSYDIQIQHRDRPLWKNLKEVYGDKWTFEIQSSLDADIPKCDLLLHDSLHTYDHLLAELETHEHKVKRWIVIHDTEQFGEHGQAPGDIFGEPDETQKGLQEAMSVFLDRYPHWEKTREVPYSCGMTTLERA